jgi:hypothetical protein
VAEDISIMRSVKSRRLRECFTGQWLNQVPHVPVL